MIQSDWCMMVIDDVTVCFITANWNIVNDHVIYKNEIICIVHGCYKSKATFLEWIFKTVKSFVLHVLKYIRLVYWAKVPNTRIFDNYGSAGTG